jgi:phosphoribosylformylglycinamidine cyclo-ligase
MSQPQSRSAYKAAGVDVEEGYRAVDLMKQYVKTTHDSRVIGGIGGFAGMMTLGGKFTEPVMVAGTDGVGTKLKLAFTLDRHDTVGIDLVAMCVNDILCQGAEPLLFLDYIATGKLKAEQAAQIVKGVSAGCRQAGAALLGGETAEMPGFYADGEYDLAGFAVGVVEKSEIITGEKIQAGDVVIGFPSSGAHSNGYSLLRKLFAPEIEAAPTSESARKISEMLLEPTRIYAPEVRVLKARFDIKGMCHITGGGFQENVPRMLKEGLGVSFDTSAWQRPAIFDLIEARAGLTREELFGTFNMGIGFMVVLSKEDAKAALQALAIEGYEASEIGVIDNKGRVSL